MGESLILSARARSCRQFWIALCLVAGCPPGANGQKLDLDPPKRPPTTWTCIEPLATSLDPARPLAALGARLLRAPAQDDADLARRLVFALTLAKASEDRSFGALNAQARERLRAGVGTLDVTSLDPFRAALRPLVVSALGPASGAAWVNTPGPSEARTSLAPLLEKARAAPDEIDAARAVDAALADPALDPASVLASVDTRAIAATLALNEAALPVRTRERFLLALSGAIARAAAGDAEQLAMLGELAAAGPVLRQLRDVSPSKINRAYEQLLRAAPDLPAAPTRSRLAIIRDLTRLATMRLPSVEQLALLRQLKPAHGLLIPSVRAAQRTLGPVVLRLLDPQESLTDPGLMSAENIFLGALEDLRSLSRISGAVATFDARGKPVARPETKAALERLLAASKTLARAKDKDAALTDFRTLRARVERAAVIADEDALRRDTDDTVREFVSKFDDIRNRYLVSLASKSREPEPALVASIELAQRILALRGRAALADPGTLGAWPGFEVSDDGLAALRLGLDEQVRGAMRAFTADRHDRAAELVAAGHQRFAAALLVSDLAHELARTGARAPSPMEELCAPEPDRVRCVGAESLNTFALIALGAEEIVALRRRGEETRELEDRLNRAALAVRLRSTP